MAPIPDELRTELLVSMAVTAIALLAITSVLASAQKSVARQDSMTQTLDGARLAIQQLDRELRSGNVLYDPALENAAVGTPGRVASWQALARRSFP